MVASKATGDLARIRKGELDDRGLSKLADTYGKLNFIRVAPITKNDVRVVVIGPGQAGDTTKKRGPTGNKQVELRKEDGGWKVFQLR